MAQSNFISLLLDISSVVLDKPIKTWQSKPLDHFFKKEVVERQLQEFLQCFSSLDSRIFNNGCLNADPFENKIDTGTIIQHFLESFGTQQFSMLTRPTNPLYEHRFDPNDRTETYLSNSSSSENNSINTGIKCRLCVPYNSQIRWVNIEQLKKVVLSEVDGDGRELFSSMCCLNNHLLYGRVSEYLASSSNLESSPDEDRHLLEEQLDINNALCWVFYQDGAHGRKILGKIDTYRLMLLDDYGIMVPVPVTKENTCEEFSDILDENFVVQKQPVFGVLSNFKEKFLSYHANPQIRNEKSNKDSSKRHDLYNNEGLDRLSFSTTEITKQMKSSGGIGRKRKIRGVMDQSSDMIITDDSNSRNSTFGKVKMFKVSTGDEEGMTKENSTPSMSNYENSEDVIFNQFSGKEKISQFAYTNFQNQNTENVVLSPEQTVLFKSYITCAIQDHELFFNLGFFKDTRIERCHFYDSMHKSCTAEKIIQDACALTDGFIFEKRMGAYSILIELYKHKRVPIWLLYYAFGENNWRSHIYPELASSLKDRSLTDKIIRASHNTTYVALDNTRWEESELPLLNAMHACSFGELLKTENGRDADYQTYCLCAVLASTNKDFEPFFLFCESKIAWFRYTYMYAYSQDSIDYLLSVDKSPTIPTLHFTYLYPEEDNDVILSGKYANNIRKRAIHRAKNLQEQKKQEFKKVFSSCDNEIISDVEFYFKRDKKEQRGQSLHTLLYDNEYTDLEFIDFFGRKRPQEVSLSDMYSNMDKSIGKFVTQYNKRHATKYYTVNVEDGDFDMFYNTSDSISSGIVQPCTRKRFEKMNPGLFQSKTSKKLWKKKNRTNPVYEFGFSSSTAKNSIVDTPLVQGKLLLHYGQVAKHMTHRVLLHSQRLISMIRYDKVLRPYHAPIWRLTKLGTGFENIENYVRYFFEIDPSQHSKQQSTLESDVIGRIIENAYESEKEFSRVMKPFILNNLLWSHYDAFVLHFSQSRFVPKWDRLNNACPELCFRPKGYSYSSGIGGSMSRDLEIRHMTVEQIDEQESPGEIVPRHDVYGYKLRYSKFYIDAKLWKDSLAPTQPDDLLLFAKHGVIVPPCIQRIIFKCIDDKVHPDNDTRVTIGRFLYSLRYSEEQVLKFFVELYRHDPKYATITYETFGKMTGNDKRSIIGIKKTFHEWGTVTCSSMMSKKPERMDGFLCPFIDPSLRIQAETLDKKSNKLRLSSQKTLDIEDLANVFSQLMKKKKTQRINMQSCENQEYQVVRDGSNLKCTTHSPADVEYNSTIGQKFCMALCRRNVRVEPSDTRNLFSTYVNKETGKGHLDTMNKPLKYTEYSMKQLLRNTHNLSPKEKEEILSK